VLASRPMSTFLLLVLAVFGSVWLWVWCRLVEPSAPPPEIYWPLAAFFLATFSLQLLRWIYRRPFEEKLWLQRTTYFFFGQFIILLFATITKDAILSAAHLLGAPGSLAQERAASLVALFLAVAGELWGIRTAWKGLRVRKVRVPLPHWPATHLGLKMVQISDLHVGSSIREGYVANVVQKALDLEPDLIVLTGDLGDGNVFELQKDLEPLRRLRAPHGVFYVAGNHEYYWNVRSWMAKMKELGFTVLENNGRWLKEAQLWVGGVPDFTAHKMERNGASEPARAFPKEPVEGPTLLLAHQPKSIFGAAKAGFDMMVCGHTHAGQFFPANLAVRFFNPYHHGLHRHEKTWVYVNAGTGFWGPPLRLFVPPEITLFRLVPEANAAAE
jgi:predicted MPP superfamily phosphohydrolase/uncharacterized protein YhhL (DUF1145 family)